MYGTEVFFFSVCCFCCWFFRYLWLVIWMQQHEIYRMPVKCVVNPIAKRWGNSNFTLFPTNSEEHLISSPFRGNWEWTNGIFHIPECIPKSCSWKFLFLHEHFICLVSRLSFQSHEESFQNNHLKLIGPRNGEKACSKFNWTFSCAVCFDSNETKAWSQQLLWVSAHWFDSDYWIICYESSSEIQEKSTK